jgi:hypothetical protein
MKRIPFLAIVLLACAFPAHAQDAMQNDATKDAMQKEAAVKPISVKAADSELKVVLDSWHEIGRKLTAMAEDFPRTNMISSRHPRSGASPSSCCTRRVQATTSRIL